MTLGLCYWIMMLIWLAFGLWSSWPGGFKTNTGHLLLFILFLLVGWKVFGPPIHN